MGVNTNLPWCHVQKILLLFVPMRLARPRILHVTKHVFSDRNKTNDHEQPRSVSIVPTLLGGS